MHPILSQLRRIIIYLLAWVPIAGLLAYLLTVSHEISDHEAIVLSVPLCLLYAFLCLSAWYSCRGNPLEKYGLGRLIATHLTAASSPASSGLSRPKASPARFRKCNHSQD